MHFSAANPKGVSGESAWFRITDFSHTIVKYPSDVFLLGELYPCSHISKCWSSKAKHNRCFSPRSRFHEERLKKRFFIHPFPKTRAKKTHSNSDIMSHIEGNKQETTVLLSVFQTQAPNKHFTLGSLLLLFSYLTRPCSPEGLTLFHLLGKPGPRRRISPDSSSAEKLGESDHYQVSLLNFILVPKEVNTTQPKIKKVRSWKFKSWNFCHHSSYLLDLLKGTIPLLMFIF